MNIIGKINAFILIVILSPLFLLLGIIIVISDGFPIFFRQKRIGKKNSVFTMIKFRTMKNGTPDNIATHLLDDPLKYNTGIGRYLRKYSIDELPQLFNVLIGDMSFIGPRPALPNQIDLLTLRKSYGIENSIPGLTGWAQINGRDHLSVEEKVEMEKYYLENNNFFIDLKILLLTVKLVLQAKGIYPDKKK